MTSHTITTRFVLLIALLALPTAATADIARIYDPIPTQPEAQRTYTTEAIDVLELIVDKSRQNQCQEQTLAEMLRIQNAALQAHGQLLALIEEDLQGDQRAHLTHFIGLLTISARTLSDSCPQRVRAVALSTLSKGTRKAFERPFAEARKSWTRCQRRAERSDGPQVGKLTLTLVIDAEGQATSLDFQGDHSLAPSLQRCLEKNVRAFEFPSTGQNVRIKRSWVFGQ